MVSEQIIFKSVCPLFFILENNQGREVQYIRLWFRHSLIQHGNGTDQGPDARGGLDAHQQGGRRSARRAASDQDALFRARRRGGA